MLSMKSTFLSFKGIWKRFNDLLTVIAIAIGLRAAYFIVELLNRQNSVLLETPFEIDVSANLQISSIFAQTSHWSLCLSLPIFLTAIYFSATNDHLTLPIRCFAVAENSIKMLLCLQSILFLACPIDYFIPLAEQPKCQTLSHWISNFRINYFIYDIPLNFQFLISISRFVALTESDPYYRYTLKLPFLQLLPPFIISILMAHTSVFWSKFLTHDDIATSFWFLMAAMDFVTYKNMQKLKRKEMVKSAEEMLMWQMLSTSLVNVLTAFFNVPIFISSLFCGPYLASVIGSFWNLLKNLLYFFVSSILNASLLRKPRELQKDRDETDFTN